MINVTALLAAAAAISHGFENLFLHATGQLGLAALSASCRDIRDQDLLCRNCMRSESLISALICIAAINVQLMVMTS